MNGEALVTLPGTSTAFTQPNPSPVTTLSSANTATETANDAKARAAATARGRSFQEVQGWVMKGRATATKTAGCLMAAPTPTATAPHHQVRHLVVTQIPIIARPIMRASL